MNLRRIFFLEREDAAPEQKMSAEPADSYERQPGKICCICYILLSLNLYYPHLSVGGILFGFLLWGGLPALLLLRSAKPTDRLCGIFRGIAIAALYAVFLPLRSYFDDVSSSDAQGGLIYIFIAPLSHGIWLLLAAPYLIRTYINKSR